MPLSDTVFREEPDKETAEEGEREKNRNGSEESERVKRDKDSESETGKERGK